MPKPSFSRKIAGPVALAILYFIVSKLCFILLFTIVTSLVLMQGRDQAQINQTINDISHQYVFIAFSVGAIFTLLMCWIRDRAFDRDTPFWQTSGNFWHVENESFREFWRGCGTGLMIPLVALTLLQGSGQVRFYGTFITSDTRSPIFFLFLFNAIALAGMVLCEEYIFRHKILRTLVGRISPTISVIMTSLGYVLVKHLQFWLTPIDYITLFLVSFAASFYFLRSGRIFRGLGFIGSLYGAVHFLCGMNLWGHSTAGLFLFTDAKGSSPTITGGADGPLAGAALLSLLLIVAVSAYWSWLKEESQSEAIAKS